MPPGLLTCFRSSALITAILLAGLVSARAQSALPEPVQQGAVTYISGGVGLDEQQAMKAAAKDYALTITYADKAGSYVTGVSVVITARDGRNVLHAEDTGPLFFAKLPAGAYRVEATHDGERRVRDVTVAERGAVDLHLVWP
jgi:hypothetical protein